MGRNGRNLKIEVGRMVVPSEPVPQQKDSTLFINRGSGHGPCHVLEPISVLKSPNIQEFLMHPA